MSEFADLTRLLRARQDLTPPQVAVAAAALAAEEVSAPEKEAFLSALGDKGESAVEVAAFAREFRTRAINPGVERWAPGAIDIVGTGGDHAGGFNISSMVVLVLASAGVPVMKHGNRGITSKCGSADLLSALGVKLDASHEELRGALDALGFCFFFAPAYHPTFKHIVPVRKAMAAQGRRTVFNILGPLINPGQPAHLLLGVFAESWVDRLADVLELLGVSAGLAVHGRLGPNAGIDELTSATPNRVRGFGRLREVDGVWEPERFGLERAPFAELQGGDLTANLETVEAVLSGRAARGLVDTIVLNASVALWICGRTPDVQTGLEQCRELLLGGAVRAKIANTRDYFDSR